MTARHASSCDGYTYVRTLRISEAIQTREQLQAVLDAEMQWHEAQARALRTHQPRANHVTT